MLRGKKLETEELKEVNGGNKSHSCGGLRNALMNVQRVITTGQGRKRNNGWYQVYSNYRDHCRRRRR